ncbi:TENP protein, partial [Oceanites oceanicus]|nr:TENP protein [Oceanites oceanicus]
LSILLSLLVPAQAARSPDSAGIITPLGLSYRNSRGLHTSLCRRLRFSSSRDQLSSIKVAELALSLIPYSGLRLNVDVDLGITPTPSTTEVMRLSILAELHMEMNPEGNLEMVTSTCKPSLEMQSTEEMERSTPRFSFHHLGNRGKEETEAQAFLGRKLCLEISKFLYFPNEQLVSMTVPLPVTPSCQVQYLPLAAPMFSEQGVVISLQTTFQVAGMAIPLPVSPVPFSIPELPSSSPFHFVLAFSEHFYTSLFFALEMAGAFNMTLPSPLTTAAMAQNITQMGSLFQEDQAVTLQAVFRSTPRVVLEEDKAALKLFLTVHVGAGSSAFQSFLSVNADMSAGLLLSASERRMTISAAVIEDVELSLAASDVGPVPAALLEELFLPTIREEVPAQINAVLSEGVFLPHVTNFIYVDVNVTIHKDYVLVPCNLQLQVGSG